MTPHRASPVSTRISPTTQSLEEIWPDMVDGKRCIRGIPIQELIDTVLKQDEVRREKGGTLEDFPIRLRGIGLHAI